MLTVRLFPDLRRLLAAALLLAMATLIPAPGCRAASPESLALPRVDGGVPTRYRADLAQRGLHPPPWHLESPSGRDRRHGIDAVGAWREGWTGRGQTLCVLDGANPHGQVRVAEKQSGRLADGRWIPGVHPDYGAGLTSGRGTGTGDVTAASGRRGGPVPGVAPHSRVIVVSSLIGAPTWHPETTPSPGPTDAGIRRCAAYHATVILITWYMWPLDGGPVVPDAADIAAIRSAVASGSVVVIAGGSAGVSIDANPQWPAMVGRSIPGAITVGPSDQSGVLATYGNWSPRYVELLAPGVGIRELRADGGIEYSSSSSDAAALVSGAVLDVAEAHPDLAPAQLESRLEATALMTHANRRWSAHGIVNVARAVR